VTASDPAGTFNFTVTEAGAYQLRLAGPRVRDSDGIDWEPVSGDWRYGQSRPICGSASSWSQMARSPSASGCESIRPAGTT
jgi:hypothetical protein